jgi:adenosylcobinamide kinase/adenosylcobinamide-phosphate guanylyltransferase
MSTSVLFTGGVRCGKSRLARTWIESGPGPRTFIATAQCPPNDREFATRINRHRDERELLWADTAEVSRDVVGAIRCAAHAGSQGVVVDCVTLWLTTLGFHSEWDEETILTAVDEFAAVLQNPPLRIAVVSNEVGSGIVPEHALGRRFRDLQGFANQRLAAATTHVALVVCGLPMWIKGNADQDRHHAP